MEHIGDDYFEFQCRCGETHLVRLGDVLHIGAEGFLCESCGRGGLTARFGERREDVICDICRCRMPSDGRWLEFFMEHEDGEQTALCPDCLMLGDDGENWKDI